MVRGHHRADGVGHRPPAPCRRPRPPSMETRDGGRCTAPELRSFDPTKPNFQSSLRCAAVLETRAGSGRRGGSGCSWPRQDRNFAYVIGAPLATWSATGRAGRQDVERVGRSAGPRRRRRRPGGAARPRVPVRRRSAASDSRVGARTSSGWADAALAHARREVVRHHSFGRPSFLVSPDTARPCMPVTTSRPTSPGCQPGRLERTVEGVLAQRQVAVLAEALLPELRHAIARRPPAIGELVAWPSRRRRTRPARPGPSPTSTAAPASPPAASSALVGSPSRRSGRHDEGGARPAERGQQGAHARAERAAEVVGADVTRQPERRRHGGGVRLVQVRGP